jgi:Ca2+-binding RTX toxin-like protein
LKGNKLLVFTITSILFLSMFGMCMQKAFAQETTSISLSATIGPAGCVISVQGSGFSPDSTVSATFNGEVLNTGTTDDTGSFTDILLTIPSDAQPGDATITVADGNGNSASAIFTVVASDVSSVTATGTATVNQTDVTGITVTIYPSAVFTQFSQCFNPQLVYASTGITVSSVYYGGIEPSGTGSLGLSSVLYYDVQTLPQTLNMSWVQVLATDTVTVSVTNVEINSYSSLEYWNGASWVSVDTTFTPPNTITGNFTVAELSGTPIAIDNPIVVKGNEQITITGNNNLVVISGGNNIIDAAQASATTVIQTGNGNNIITLGEGDNILKDNAKGNDLITAGNGNNQIAIAGNGNDLVIAGNGDNQITTTGKGNENIIVGNGDNSIQTGAGNDLIIVGNGNNYVDGGAGHNICIERNGQNTVLNCQEIIKI